MKTIDKLIEKYNKADKFHDKLIAVLEIIMVDPRADFLKKEQVVNKVIKAVVQNVSKAGLDVASLRAINNRVLVSISNPNTKSGLDFNLVDEVDEDDLQKLMTFDDPSEPSQLEWPPEGYSAKIEIYSKKYWEPMTEDETNALNEHKETK